MRKPLELAPLSPAHLEELDPFYRTPKDVRWRTRRQIILLAAEQKMSAPTLAALRRETAQTIHKGLQRYPAERMTGLDNAL